MKKILLLSFALVLAACLHQNPSISEPPAPNFSTSPTEQASPEDGSQSQNATTSVSHTGMKHQQCGQIAEMVMEGILTIVKSLIGDVSICGYGLRVNSLSAYTAGKSLTVQTQYMDSGVVEKYFYPNPLTNGVYGGGIYRKTSGAATGANGMVRLKIQGTDDYLILFAENSWSTRYLGAVCLQQGMDSYHKDAKTTYYYIYDTAYYYVSQWGFWASNRLYCKGLDFYVTGKVQKTLIIERFGHKANFTISYQQTDLTSAQTCKKVGISAYFLY